MQVTLPIMFSHSEFMLVLLHFCLFDSRFHVSGMCLLFERMYEMSKLDVLHSMQL